MARLIGRPFFGSMSHEPEIPPILPVAQAKSLLRSAMHEELKRLTPSERQRASEQVCDCLRQQQVWRRARSVLCYAPRPDELDISCLVEEALAQGKLVALPQYQAKSRSYRACQIASSLATLQPGAFGIREPDGARPVPMNNLDLILVPGVAFDQSGRRLGHGRGFYDQLLANAPGVKCGVGFDPQLRDHIPVEAHDVLLDCIVTPRLWLDCRPRRYGDDVVGQ